jgi:predicted amidohydrolase YtcJ
MRLVTTTPVCDRHTHVSLYGALLGCPVLTGLDLEGALALLGSLPEDRVTTVLGWQSGAQRFSASELERLPPALLVNQGLHGLALTPAAAALLRGSEPELVERHADASWSERNLPRLLSLYARMAGLSADKLDEFMLALEAQGVGGAEDMLLSGHEAWRVMSASRWAPRLRAWASPELYPTLPSEAQTALAGLKLFLDGALGAWTAALSEAYRGGGTGLLLHSDVELRRSLLAARATGKPVALHAIGDRAIEQGLNALEELARAGVGLAQVRLEHAQFITEPQARRARDLGLVLSMQPNFNAESETYADRLGPRALEANDPFRMLIDQVGFRPGHDLLFGSDGMPHGIEEAARWALFPAYPGQRLTLDELLAGYDAEAGPDGSIALAVDEVAKRVCLVRGPSGGDGAEERAAAGAGRRG